jgi:regulator of RNase E activity RraA
MNVILLVDMSTTHARNQGSAPVGSLAVSHAYVHIVGIGSEVEIGGLKIRSGDLLHGDTHGVQTIPLDIVAQIPPVAAQIAAKEQAVIALCRSPDFSLDKLRAIIAEG